MYRGLQIQFDCAILQINHWNFEYPIWKEAFCFLHWRINPSSSGFRGKKRVPSSLEVGILLLLLGRLVAFPLKPQQPLVLHLGCTVTYLRDKQLDIDMMASFIQKPWPTHPPDSPHHTMPESSHLSGSLWTLRFTSLSPSNWNPASSLCVCWMPSRLTSHQPCSFCATWPRQITTWKKESKSKITLGLGISIPVRWGGEPPAAKANGPTIKLQ